MGVGGRGVGVVGSKNFSSFELCSPFVISMPSFIHVGPKLAKLVFWGGLGGYGLGWLGWLGRLDQKRNSRFELCLSFLTLTPNFILIGQK